MTATAPAFASASEALETARAALGYLASSDATAMAEAEQAGCLEGLERVVSVTTAARCLVLGAFTAGKGYSADADYSPRSWLIHKTGITSGAAVSYTAWAKRAVAHPEVFAVLAAGDISESFARTVCIWTDKLPAASRDSADAILMAGAVRGLGLPDLAMLVSEMLARSWPPGRPDRPDQPGPDPEPGPDPGGQPDGDGQPAGDGEPGDGEPGPGPDPDDGRDEAFEDRALKLLITFGGAGVLHGDLTPECAEIVNTVLDALAAKAGPEDSRTRDQRYHDALQEATAPRGAALYRPRSGQEWEELFLGLMAYLDPKGEGDNSMPGNRQFTPRRMGWRAGGPA